MHIHLVLVVAIEPPCKPKLPLHVPFDSHLLRQYPCKQKVTSKLQPAPKKPLLLLRPSCQRKVMPFREMLLLGCLTLPASTEPTPETYSTKLKKTCEKHS